MGLIGQHVDGHEIVRPLGIGGMGEVYLAKNRKGDVRALKVVRTDRATSPQAAARFRREAKALARMRHPGIVQILDAGTLPGGVLYMSMEYVSGPDLARAVETDGAYAVPEALVILARLASALAYAHDNNVIHRDLKPSNVILADGDPTRAKIIDFGLAKIIAEEGLTLTDEAQVLGSPGYWAPEQSTSSKVGPAADVYALGALSYVVLSGAPMFRPRPAVAMIYAHANEVPDTFAKRGVQVPEELAQLLGACVAKAAGDRPATSELASALEKLSAALPSTAFARKRKKSAPVTTPHGEAVASQIRNVLLDLAAALEQPIDEIDRIQTELSEIELELALDPDDSLLLSEVNRFKRELADAFENLHDAVHARRMGASVDARSLFDELDGLVERSHSA